MRILQAFIGVLLFGISSGSEARGYFSGNSLEDQKAIANGQGVSSPSFWEALGAQNAAGLTYNQRLKFQAAAASFDDSSKNLRGSASVLFGANALSGGLQYSQYSTGPFPSGNYSLNWGLGSQLESAHLRFGLSGHHWNAGTGSYDLGLLFEPLSGVRLGVQLPAIQNGIGELGTGLTFELDPAFDLVVDAALNTRTDAGTVKPGITLHADRFQLSGSYGYAFKNGGSSLLTEKASVALGIKLVDHVLIEYAYQGLVRHQLGLTLR